VCGKCVDARLEIQPKTREKGQESRPDVFLDFPPESGFSRASRRVSSGMGAPESLQTISRVFLSYIHIFLFLRKEQVILFFILRKVSLRFGYRIKLTAGEPPASDGIDIPGNRQLSAPPVRAVDWFYVTRPQKKRAAPSQERPVR